MSTLIAVVLALIPLSAPFGEATATATSTDGGLRFEVSVEVQGNPVAVLVRGVGPGASELPPVALDDEGDGTWVGIVQLPVVENILLGFEFIPQSGPATVSEFYTLVELGVDRAVFESSPQPTAPDVTTDPSPVSPEGRRWGWLGLAAGAAALTLIAFWAIGSVRSGDAQDGDAQDGDAQDGEIEPPATDG